MKTITPTDTLRQNIALLRIKRDDELIGLKYQYKETIESLKPVNLIKNAFKGTYKEVTESPDIKEGVGKAALGLTSGYLIKKLLFSGGANPLMKIAGLAVQSAATTLVAKNSDKIKSAGEKVLHFLQDKFRKH